MPIITSQSLIICTSRLLMDIRLIMACYLDAPEVIASNSSSRNIIILGEMLYLQCSFSGFPIPIVQWFHNNVLLMDGVNGTIINVNQNTTSIMIVEVDRTSGGTYTCRARNSIGTDQKSYSILIVLILSKS